MSRNIRKVELEDAIDQLGLDGVLELISEICHEKAEHVQSTWQDKELARVWTRNAKVAEKAAGKMESVS